MEEEETCADLECPGMFCGQVNISNTSTLCYSSCQACPTGYRVLNSSICEPCDSPATARDYLYLVFICLVTLFLRITVTTVTNWSKLKSFWMLPLYIVPVVEVLLAVIFTLLSLSPQGFISINACTVNNIGDFYPIFFNPKSDYVHEIHCTYEVVYPLYSMVFIFFGFHFALHLPLLITVLSVCYLSWSKYRKEFWSARTEYVWLIIFPIILLLYSVTAGIIYYAFDYLTIVISLCVFAVLSTIMQIHNFGDFENPFKVYKLPVQWLLTVSSMIALACGILSLTEWADVTNRALFIPLILAPPILQPILTHFASPQFQFEAWDVKKMEDDFFDY